PRPRIGFAFTEPLIHPQILDFCRTVVARGFYCQVTSNGSMLPRVADRLVDIGVDKIVLSIDGPPDVHDRIRGRDGSFRGLLTGALQLNAAKARLRRARPEIGISFTVTDANHDRMLDFVRAVEPMEPAEIHVSHLNFISRRMADVHNALYDGDLRVAPSSLQAIDPDRMPWEAMFEEVRRVKAHAQSKAAGSPRIRFAPDASDPEILRTFY